MPEINKKELATHYGFALAFLNSSPELKKLFNKAVKQTWTADRFIAELRGTKWFKKHSASVRNAIMQKKADPATYKANVDKMYATVRDTWGSMFGQAEMNRKELKGWAETAHRLGWSEAELMDRMARSVDYRKLLKRDSLGGTAAETRGQMEAILTNYGLPLGDNWKAARLKDIMEGDTTIAQVQEKARMLAMSEYKAFAERIAAGETVMEIADPYISKMSELLEVNPNDIGLRDKKIQEALKQRTQDGKPAAMDLHTFEDFVRKDSRWQYTDNAKKSVTEATHGLLRNFGLIA